MTLKQVKNLRGGEIILHKKNKNADGTPQRWRINGEVKRWKRDPDRVLVPIKHGLYTYDYLDNENLKEFQAATAEGGEEDGN